MPYWIFHFWEAPMEGGTCKVWNEIEMKQNQTKRNETERNETKPIETKGNETKRIVTKSNKTKCNEKKWKIQYGMKTKRVYNILII
jgi:hypothetical protein